MPRIAVASVAGVDSNLGTAVRTTVVLDRSGGIAPLFVGREFKGSVVNNTAVFSAFRAAAGLSCLRHDLLRLIGGD